MREASRATHRGNIEAIAAAVMDTGRAWLAVAAAFAASFVVFGIVYSFGVFLKPVAAEFGAAPTAVAAFFSITASAYYGLGAFAGRAADRLGPRIVVMAGAAVLGLGLALTALVRHIWVGYLTYGLGVGIGGACCYVPTLAAVGGWFERRRNLALGVAAAGTGAGTMVVPPFAASLIHHFGWRMTDVIFAAAGALILFGCAIMTRAPPIARSAGPARTPRRLFGSREFVLLYLSWVLATTGLFVPFVFLPAFARDHGIGEVAAAALVSLIGGTSIVGRLVLGPLGDRFGVVRLFKLTVLMMAISYAIWLLSSSYLGLAIFAVVLGINYGSRIAAVPAVLIEYFGVDNLGTILGVFFTATGLAALLGPTLAGLAVDLSGGYYGGILFALAAGILGFLAIVPLQSERFGTRRIDRA
jgi:MFS family permease